MEFKKFIHETELDEGWRDWLAGAKSAAGKVGKFFGFGRKPKSDYVKQWTAAQNQLQQDTTAERKPSHPVDAFRQKQLALLLPQWNAAFPEGDKEVFALNLSRIFNNEEQLKKFYNIGTRIAQLDGNQNPTFFRRVRLLGDKLRSLQRKKEQEQALEPPPVLGSRQDYIDHAKKRRGEGSAVHDIAQELQRHPRTVQKYLKEPDPWQPAIKGKRTPFKALKRTPGELPNLKIFRGEEK